MRMTLTRERSTSLLPKFTFIHGRWCYFVACSLPKLTGTRPDATLREIASLLKQARSTETVFTRRMARFNFSSMCFVRSRWQQKQMGTVQSLEKAEVNEKTLADYGFQPGDMLCVCVS